MPTAQSYINRALRLVNVIADGETPNSSIATDCLTILNDMLGLWNIDKLLIYQIEENTHTLVAGTATYTVGSGATINITRPNKIQQAFIRDSSNYDGKMSVINQEEYNRITDKTTQSDFPDRLYYDPGFANGTIYLYPTPSTANTLHFFNWKPFSTFATLVTSATFPDGYNQLLTYNLAVLISAEFGTPLRQDVLNIALDTKEKISGLNNSTFSDITVFDGIFSGRTNNGFLND